MTPEEVALLKGLVVGTISAFIWVEAWKLMRGLTK